MIDHCLFNLVCLLFLQLGQASRHHDAMARATRAPDGVPRAGFGLLRLFLWCHRTPPPGLPPPAHCGLALSGHSAHMRRESEGKYHRDQWGS